MALVVPFYVRRPSHPLGNLSLLASQRRVPATTTGTRLWLPSDLGSKLQLWLKGDDLTGANGSSIANWPDATANANDTTGAAALPTLVTSGLNGMNTVAFDGVGQYMTPPTGLLTGRTQSASFAVYKLTTDPPSSPAVGPVFGDFGTDATTGNHNPFSDGIFYDDYCSTTRRTVTGIPSSTLFRILGLRSKASDWRLDVNGTNYYTDGTNTFGANNAPCIGSTRVPAGYYLQGQIAEIVDCNDFLTTAEKEQVEGYLAWKWGLEGYLPIGHTYAAAAPRTATAASNEISGTSSLTFASSATATGLGTLGGSSALTFVDSGTLTGLGSVTGSSSLVLSPNATATGLAALLGTSALTFAPSATATGLGGLIGSSTFALTPSGTVTGLGSLIGSSSLTFATTGTAAGLGTLAGTAPLSLTGSGALTGLGSLLASTALSFTLSGSIGASGSNNIIGNAALTFGSSATLQGLGQLQGSTQFSLTLSGVLIAGGPSETNVIGAVRPGKVSITNA
jgi:hypothetical protein